MKHDNVTLATLSAIRTPTTLTRLSVRLCKVMHIAFEVRMLIANENTCTFNVQCWRTCTKLASNVPKFMIQLLSSVQLWLYMYPSIPARCSLTSPLMTSCARSSGAWRTLQHVLEHTREWSAAIGLCPLRQTTLCSKCFGGTYYKRRDYNSAHKNIEIKNKLSTASKYGWNTIWWNQMSRTINKQSLIANQGV